jgi:hypothetical protein
MVNNNKDINKWEDYKSRVYQAIRENRGYYYRGQTDSRWELKTSFHRIASDIKVNLIDYLDKILPAVHYQVSAFHNEISDLNNPNEFRTFLPLIQHHGFPTPLLDWTLSPYIAAFFAFKDINDKNPQCDFVRIFVFDNVEWSKSFEQPQNLRISKKFISNFIPFAKNNPRLIPQKGVYTITNVNDMEQHIKNCENHVTKKFLTSFMFPVKERTIILRELSLMGINEMTLFPGLDGLCKTLKEEFFSSAEIGLTPSQKMAVLIKALDKKQKLK